MEEDNLELRAHVANTFKQVYKKADYTTHYFLSAYFLVGLALSAVHDTWIAGIVGGGFSVISYYLIKSLRSGARFHAYYLSFVLGLFNIQFIYQMHGMVEMRLMIFVGAVYLMNYQQWRLMIPLAVVLLVHHNTFAYLESIGQKDFFFTDNSEFSLSGFLLMLCITTLVIFLCGKWSHDIARRTKQNAVNDYMLHEQLKNIKTSVAFAQTLANGNLEAGYELRKDDELGISLISLRDNLKLAKAREDEEKYFNAGLARAAEILRANHDLRVLSDEIIGFLVKYLNVNQGTLFIMQEEENSSYLEMVSCYAYNKKRFVNKRVEVGQGIAGQAVLEKEVIYLTEIPKNYITITSGLGEATPRAILVSPLIINEKIYGVIEIASFHPLEKYKIEFIKKVGETIASSISMAKINKHTQQLLNDSQELTEVMRAQEEEMRQNMEELQASQEEMNRKQNELEGSQGVMNLIIDLVPFPIFLKDSQSRYTLVNKAQAKLFNREVEDFLGKTDDHFVTNLAESTIIKQSDKKILEEQQTVNIPEQTISLPGREKRILQTTKVPFFNALTKEFNILGVSIDLTESKLTEQKLKLSVEEMKAMQVQIEEKQHHAEDELEKIKQVFNEKLKEISSKNNINLAEDDLI